MTLEQEKFKEVLIRMKIENMVCFVNPLTVPKFWAAIAEYYELAAVNYSI